MTQADPVLERARSDLEVRIDRDQTDLLLWERALRVWRMAERLMKVPQIVGDSKAVDGAALRAAVLYHDAGWTSQCREGNLDRLDLLNKPTSDLQRELAAGWMKDRLSDLMPARSLSVAHDILLQCGRRDTEMLEAKILSDTENLDDIGPLAIWQTVRRLSNEGKNVTAALETWQRQREYRFWEARIKDCFHFEMTRRLARYRFSMLERFYEAIRMHGDADDLDVVFDLSAGISRPSA